MTCVENVQTFMLTLTLCIESLKKTEKRVYNLKVFYITYTIYCFVLLNIILIIIELDTAFFNKENGLTTENMYDLK